jgi:hypothetical protein
MPRCSCTAHRRHATGHENEGEARAWLGNARTLATLLSPCERCAPTLVEQWFDGVSNDVGDLALELEEVVHGEDACPGAGPRARPGLRCGRRCSDAGDGVIVWRVVVQLVREGGDERREQFARQQRPELTTVRRVVKDGATDASVNTVADGHAHGGELDVRHGQPHLLRTELQHRSDDTADLLRLDIADKRAHARTTHTSVSTRHDTRRSAAATVSVALLSDLG